MYNKGEMLILLIY